MDISIKFYIKDGIKYILYFPEEWFPHIDNSGPIHCEQCKNTGMVNDIFIFYCSDCLLNVYNNKSYYGTKSLNFEPGVFQRLQR